ncbi:MAG: RNA methyltransferase [Muribaculaceae bacterium]|nr:RNA methyltransferase [Muribaculaceae bacterium]
MAEIIEINNINDPRVAPFASLTEAQLRSRIDPANALFIAESPKVIAVALDRGYIPQAMLCEQRHIAGDAAPLLERCPARMPLYTGPRQLLQSLTGYKLTRGVLAAIKRPELPSVKDVCRNARRVAVIDSVVDTTNIGAIFRAAAALGIDAILLTPTSCDPLNRRAVRVSMGSVFLIPWTWLNGPVSQLNDLGFKTVAMALTDRSVPIDDPQLNSEQRLAIVLGTEGDGLAAEVLSATDYVARIPMAHNVDSLNVAAAAAVAFWQLRPHP